jgi:ADP-heptose:LPS heptosyltransferase
LASISPNELAAELLSACLAGETPAAERIDALAHAALDPDPFVAGAASRALFAGLAEPLADRFEPALCDAYARLFSRVLALALPEQNADALFRRYQQVRRVRPVEFEPTSVYVLSRVTLGADVAITSVVLDGARQRFPRARICFAGPRKAWELFERAPGLSWLPVEYPRQGTLAGRLAVRSALEEAFRDPGALVLDPDSRLTQLGLLPVCEPDRHFLFESRGYGGESNASLTALAADWVRRVLGVEETMPWLQPKYSCGFGSQPVAAVSLGVGDNPAKRVDDPFEEELLLMLSERIGLVMVDAGAPGSEEEERVRRAAGRAQARGARVGIHEGPFASFAALIAASSFYAGYDSAGQHVAAAAGVPQVCVFNGYACERAIRRWAPDGPAPAAVVRAAGRSPEEVISEVRRTLEPAAESRRGGAS